VIYELLAFLHRRRRYQIVSELLIPIITKETQARLDKTLTDAYEKSLAQGASPEEARGFSQDLVNKVNELLARENGLRVRQWTEAILDMEEKR
jgi:hypothetical protein